MSSVSGSGGPWLACDMFRHLTAIRGAVERTTDVEFPPRGSRVLSRGVRLQVEAGRGRNLPPEGGSHESRLGDQCSVKAEATNLDSWDQCSLKAEATNLDSGISVR